MTLDEAKKRVQEIRDMAGDDESAHWAEDQLYLDFVRYVASREGPYSDVAAEILKTGEIDFARWCA